jgi:hypothetical protein
MGHWTLKNLHSHFHFIAHLKAYQFIFPLDDSWCQYYWLIISACWLQKLVRVALDVTGNQVVLLCHHAIMQTLGDFSCSFLNT